MTFPGCTWQALLKNILLVGAALPIATAAAQTTETPPMPPAPPASAELKAEEPFTQKMLPPQPQWAYVRGGGGVRIFDGATGKMRGEVDTTNRGDIALDPGGKYYYVSDTIWSKGDRGMRQDFVAIYDTTELKLQIEIPIPGRIIIGGEKHNFILSDDGQTGYIYNYNPASSVNMVDLVKRKFVRGIELPGCASLIPNPVGFSALCSDGTIITVDTSTAKAKITRSASFFPATGDPIFSNFTYDKSRKQVTFVSYTGLVYQATMGAVPTVMHPYSIQQAAGVRPGETKPLEVNWLPGGRGLMALHRPTDKLYVLMHKGEYWSQNEPGQEIWELDLVSHKVVMRHPLKAEISNIEITQDATPLLFINDKDGTTYVLDAKTLEEKRKIEKTGSGLILTTDVDTSAMVSAAAPVAALVSIAEASGSRAN